MRRKYDKTNLNFPGLCGSLNICKWSASFVLFEHHTYKYNTFTFIESDGLFMFVLYLKNCNIYKYSKVKVSATIKVMQGEQSLAWRLRCMPLNPGSWVRALHRITTMIPHMAPELVHSRKWTRE